VRGSGDVERERGGERGGEGSSGRRRSACGGEGSARRRRRFVRCAFRTRESRAACAASVSFAEAIISIVLLRCPGGSERSKVSEHGKGSRYCGPCWPAHCPCLTPLRTQTYCSQLDKAVALPKSTRRLKARHGRCRSCHQCSRRAGACVGDGPASGRQLEGSGRARVGNLREYQGKQLKACSHM
jgi:hypothetical protein